MTDCTPPTSAWVILFLALVLALLLGAVVAFRETADTPRARRIYGLAMRILGFSMGALAVTAVAVLAGAR